MHLMFTKQKRNKEERTNTMKTSNLLVCIKDNDEIRINQNMHESCEFFLLRQEQVQMQHSTETNVFFLQRIAL